MEDTSGWYNKAISKIDTSRSNLYSSNRQRVVLENVHQWIVNVGFAEIVSIGKKDTYEGKGARSRAIGAVDDV